MTGSNSQHSDAQRPPVWKMVREAMNELGPSTTNVAVRDWILRGYPDTNTGTISCQTIFVTVNHNSRIHYPENTKPRLANTKYDLLFRPARGQLELYDSAKHGQWEIRKGETGRLEVGLAGEGRSSPGAEGDAAMHTSSTPCLGIENGEEPPTSGQFILEAHLRDFVAQNLEVVEPGLELYVDEAADVAGVEYVIPVGRIDILARDHNGTFVVFEFKVGRGSDVACGQILRYMSWVKMHLAKNEKVRGCIIANKVTERLRYAAAMVPAITLMEYELDFRLSPAELASPGAL